MATRKQISEAAAALGRKGGKVKSDAKAIAARLNASKPRKPRKTKRDK